MTTTATTPTDAPTAVTQSPPSDSMSTGHARDRSIWTATRVIGLAFTVLEVLLLVRFVLKLLAANADQPLASAIYGVTEPLVVPFRGIFAQPASTPVVEIATLLSILFFVLVAMLVVAIVRALTGRRSESTPR